MIAAIRQPCWLMPDQRPNIGTPPHVEADVRCLEPGAFSGTNLHAGRIPNVQRTAYVRVIPREAEPKDQQTEHAARESLMRLDDRAANRQAETHTLRLGCEERLEEPVGYIWRKARA